ncbi:hypothetical protein J4558_03175 [Leptolyngbya sp. 15MV]|nr:hypothetical protein J4558_03175 [Leptolyngbya sp. 15MV]
MGRLRWSGLLAASLVAQPLAAQEATVPIPSAAMLERMCSERGTMQFAFGQTGVPGSTRLESLMRQGFNLPPALAPFTEARPRATEWSGRLMEMTYAVPMEDEAQAYAMLEMLGNALEEAGWSYTELTVDEAPMYLIAVTGYVTFERATEGENGPTRVLVGLDYGLGEATMSCARDDLLRTHAEEAFGKLPAETPRPAVPEIPVPLVTDVARCGEAAVIAEMEAMMAERKLRDAFFAAMLARTNYRDRLTSWMLWRLSESGKISSTDLVELSFAAIGDASPGGDPLAAFSRIETMFPILDRVAKAETARDGAGLCRGLVEMHGWLVEVDAITLAQTEAVQARLTREAARLSVSLD